MRQMVRHAAGKAADIVHIAPVGLVKVMQAVRTVPYDAPDDGGNHKGRYGVRGPAPDTEVIQSGQPPQEIGEDKIQVLEEVGVVDSRLLFLRLAARAVGT